MKVKCPVIFESLRHQVWESSLFRPLQVQPCRLEVIWEELFEACLQPTLSSSYFEIQIFDFCVAPFIHLGNIYSFSSAEFTVLWPTSTSISQPWNLSVIVSAEVESYWKFSSTTYKPTFCRQSTFKRNLVPYCLHPDLDLVCRQADICFVFALLS